MEYITQGVLLGKASLHYLHVPRYELLIIIPCLFQLGVDTVISTTIGIVAKSVSGAVGVHTH